MCLYCYCSPCSSTSHAPVLAQKKKISSLTSNCLFCFVLFFLDLLFSNNVFFSFLSVVFLSFRVSAILFFLLNSQAVQWGILDIFALLKRPARTVRQILCRLEYHPRSI